MSKTMLVDARKGLRWTTAHSHKTATLAPSRQVLLAAALVVTVAVCDIRCCGEPHEQPAEVLWVPEGVVTGDHSMAPRGHMTAAWTPQP